MNVVICDITGRTINYDVALCDAINEKMESNDSLEFWSAGLTEKYPFRYHVFRSFVPKKYRSVAHGITRILKAFDAIGAYIWILLELKKRKIDIIHLQWLPFISLGLTGAAIDLRFLSLIKKISPQTRLVFTIHNMCPHRMSEDDRKRYNPVFAKALEYFDAYVVHTENTKEEVVNILKLSPEKVNVIYHGIFSPFGYVFKPSNLSGKYIHLLMYGFQHPYKGTDVFVEALSLLKNNTKEKLKVRICGAFGSGFLEKCKNIETGVDITWIPEFLSDDMLYNEINNADILFFPYRRISQSGALLLALHTRKFLVTSNLPTFVETLKGFPEELFFRSESSVDLARLIELYVSGKVDKIQINESISKLNILYSWKKSADDSIKMYKSIE